MGLDLHMHLGPGVSVWCPVASLWNMRHPLPPCAATNAFFLLTTAEYSARAAFVWPDAEPGCSQVRQWIGGTPGFGFPLLLLATKVLQQVHVVTRTCRTSPESGTRVVLVLANIRA